MDGKRGSGILLHVTSLPSRFGIGDMGPDAYRFVDFLAAAGQRYWQILPLNPTDPIHHDTPYHSISAFAGNPLLISPDFLVQDKYLSAENIEAVSDLSLAKVDYEAARGRKEALLKKAYGIFKGRAPDPDYERFCREQSSWLDIFALFRATKAKFAGRVWSDWPGEFRDRENGALNALCKEAGDLIEEEKFYQYIFFRQWHNLKHYGNEHGIQIIGDIPIYINYDSADVWLNPDLFKLDESRKPIVVAGVPPDYFSSTGQLWGNPIYRWDVMQKDCFAWWVERIRHNLGLFDLVRIDHFRGLVGYWEVPATEKTAIPGKWVQAPAMDFFRCLAEKFSPLPVIAEDLGIITPDVREVMDHFGFPGMKVLLFAFGADLPTNPYIPHNLPQDCIAYTGTHDNNTVVGWFLNETPPEDRQRLFRYLGREVSAEELSTEMIRLVMMSVAGTAIFPMQDILGLGEEARMNTPATIEGNWQWRLLPDQISPELAQELRGMTEIYGRI